MLLSDFFPEAVLFCGCLMDSYPSVDLTADGDIEDDFAAYPGRSDPLDHSGCDC